MSSSITFQRVRGGALSKCPSQLITANETRVISHHVVALFSCLRLWTRDAQVWSERGIPLLEEWSRWGWPWRWFTCRTSTVSWPKDGQTSEELRNWAGKRGQHLQPWTNRECEERTSVSVLHEGDSFPGSSPLLCHQHAGQGGNQGWVCEKQARCGFVSSKTSVSGKHALNCKLRLLLDVISQEIRWNSVTSLRDSFWDRLPGN